MRGRKINGLGARGQNRHRLGLTWNARGEFIYFIPFVLLFTSRCSIGLVKLRSYGRINITMNRIALR